MRPFGRLTESSLILQLHARRARLAYRRAGGALLISLLLGLTGLGTIGTALALQVRPSAAPVAPAMTTTARPAVEVMPAAAPTGLTIPDLAIDAPLDSTGLAADGAIAAPSGKNYHRPAWYNGSPTPGQAGAAVIVGHVDHYRDGPSTFFRLAELRPGQTIDVAREDGTTARFAVDAVRAFERADFPAEEAYAPTADQSAELRLITCSGEFDRATGSYEQNTVVYASLKP